MFVCSVLSYLEASSRDNLIASNERVRLQCDIVLGSDSGLPRLVCGKASTQTIIIEWHLPKFGQSGPSNIKLNWYGLIDFSCQVTKGSRSSWLQTLSNQLIKRSPYIRYTNRKYYLQYNTTWIHKWVSSEWTCSIHVQVHVVVCFLEQTPHTSIHFLLLGA